MRFRFIEDRRTDYPVTMLCDVLGISPAGYYAWRARPESRRSAANRDLVDDIKRVHRDTSGRYGSPRIHAELRAQGRGASRGRIERLMRRHGIRAIMARPRRWQLRRFKYAKADLSLILKMDKSNTNIQAYYLLPTAHLALKMNYKLRMASRVFAEEYRHDSLGAFHRMWTQFRLGSTQPTLSPM